MYFYPFIFFRSLQLFKIKQEDHIPSMPTIGLVFFLARSCQHKPNKMRITIQHLSSSSYAFYKIETILKALYQLNLILLEKYAKQYVTYFYQILHIIMNPAKFGSPHLDTPSLRYKILKFSFKSVKINKENQISNRTEQLGAQVQCTQRR